MEARLWRYRLAGVFGGLMLAAGNFFGLLCVLQLGAFVPLLILCSQDKRPRWAALAGMYMGIVFSIPQMVYLRMPLPVTVVLLLEFTVMLVALCAWGGWCMKAGTLLGCFAFGAGWMLLDWLNYTAIPIWGMAQSFARSWTAYPFAIGFISFTGISGILLVAGTIAAMSVHIIVNPKCRNVFVSVLAGILLWIVGVDWMTFFVQAGGEIRVAAAGWIFDDRKKTNDPHTEDGFQKLFAEPAAKAAAVGARIFTTGEMGFYIANCDRAEWMARFAEVAKKNNLYLVIGYFNISADENRIFFMNPQGMITAEYTKTYLTPFEPGKKGNGNLQTIEVDSIKVGAMICQDDNFSRLTRAYGRNKTPLVLCPTADWWTIKDAHLQAVRARAIECGYAIARGAANGISAIVSPTGEILAQRDHYRDGPGYVIADVPVRDGVTFFSRFGYWPMVVVSGLLIAIFMLHNIRQKE